MTASQGRFFPGSLFVPLLVLAACAGPPQREGVTPVQAHMYAHFDRAGEVHDALVRGQIDRARAEARWLATHPETRMLPVGSEPYSAAMAGHATSASEASDLQHAAIAAAQMGRTCGDCHRQYDVKPRFLVGTAAPTGSGPAAEMALHVWAADRMWQGLIGPDDFAWTSGARGLTLGWLNPGEVVADPGDRERLRNLIRQVYELAARAEMASDPEARAEVYGAFLTTCIDCHQLTGAIIR
jgi:hypothetical protein